MRPVQHTPLCAGYPCVDLLLPVQPPPHDMWLQGVGLCHGMGGNGYALLDLYRATGESKHLERAQRFAHCIANSWQQLYSVPDRPASLYEVTATVCLVVLCDATKPVCVRHAVRQSTSVSLEPADWCQVW